MHRIYHLYYLHDWWNKALFDNQLLHLTILCKRSNFKDGYYSYKAHKDWTPIRNDLDNAFIMIADGCEDPEGTLVHEMIHQWQCEVLNEAPHHNDRFKEMARTVEEQYGLDVM
jgi:hypothetical protein